MGMSLRLSERRTLPICVCGRYEDGQEEKQSGIYVKKIHETQ